MQSSTSSCDYSSSSRTPERYQPHRHDSNCNNSTCSDDKGLVTAVEHNFTAKLRTDEHHLQYLHHHLHKPQMLTHRSGMAERAGTTTGDGEELNVEEFGDNHKLEEEVVEVKSEGTVTEECSSSPCSSLDKRIDLEVGAACSREKPAALVGIVRGGRPSWVDSAWGPRCVTSHDNRSCVTERVVCERIFSEVLGDAVTGSPEESSDGPEDSWGRVLKEGVNKLPSSQYRGVVPQPNGRWGAQIYEKHQRVWLGTFNREEDAARAYDRAAVKFRGRDAMSNFRPVEESEAVFLRQHSKEQIVEMLRRHTYDDELEESKRLVSICMPATSPETPAVSMDLNRINESNPTASSSQPERSMEREYLFEKAVTPSDVGKLNRLVIPKQHAERCFPLDLALNAPCQILSFEDVVGKHWRFRYSYWNSSQSYVFTKGWSRFVKEKKLSADDIVSFQRGPNRELYIDFRRRVNNQVPPQVLPPPSMMHMISDSEIAGSSWVPGGASTKARGLNTPTMWHQLNLQNLYSFHKTKEQLFSQRMRTQQQQQFVSFPNIQQQQLQEQLMHVESRSVNVSLPQRTMNGDNVFLSQELRRCTDHEGGAAAEGRNFAASTVVVKQPQHQVVNQTAATSIALPVSSTAIGSATSGGTRLFGVDLERTSPSSMHKNVLDRETSTVSSSNYEKSHVQQFQSLNTRDASSTMYQRESGFQDMRTNCKRIMQHGRSTTPVTLGTELKEQSPFMIMGLSFVKCRGVEHESASRKATATNNSNLQLMSSISVDDEGSTGGASSARSELLGERKPSPAAAAAAGGPVVVVSVSMAAGDHSRKRKVDILESLRNSKSKYTLADTYERYNGAPNTSLSLAQHSEPMT